MADSEQVTVVETTTTTTTEAPKETKPVAIPTKTTDQQIFPPTKQQSVNVNNSGVYRRNKYEDAIVGKRFEDIPTAYHSLKRAAEKYASSKCLGYRPIDPTTKKALPFVYETYKQVYDKVKYTAAGLRKLGVQPRQHCGLYAKNRPEWQIAAEAMNTQAMVSIALYDTLGEDSSLYIMNHGEIVALFASGECMDKVFGFAPQCQYLKHIICLDKIEEKYKEKVANLSAKVIEFNELLELGKQNPIDDNPPEADDLMTIMYTSGTTGTPKGVMITHRNVIAAGAGVSLALFRIIPNEDCILSYLPLAHIFMRVAESCFLQSGACIAYWQGDIKLISEDIQAAQPTVLAAVPRVLDRMYDRIKGKIEQASGIQKYLFDSAYESKKYYAPLGQATNFWDLLVFNKFKANTGGKLRGIISGGAPLRPEVQEFLRTCFDVPICQGYGLTETCAAGTLQLPQDFTYGHIGAPLPCNEFKLVSIPEMNYLVTDNPPRGEICIRGPNVALGYYKEPKKTQEVFDSEGWFHTGDVGRVNANGTFAIFDRIKNIFKLAQGEYVAAENLEIILGQTPFISQIWIYGNSFKTSLVAVVVPNPETLTAYAQEKGITGDFATIIKNPVINKAILDALNKKGKEGKLKPYEFPKRVFLFDKEFALVDCVTPSMKLKRNTLQQLFQAEIDKMYAEIDADEEAAKKKELAK